MIYREYPPSEELGAFIDTFWTVKNEAEKSGIEKILPDGCVDIIVNLGAACKTDNGFTLETNKVYLIGTMRKFQETYMSPETHLVGIRFKPSTFSAFYDYTSLHQIADQIVEFDRSLSPDRRKLTQHTNDYLNRFFLERLSAPKHQLSQVINTIQLKSGQIKIEELSKMHFITPRQLERMFKQHIGISPKEFANIIRFKNALKQINDTSSKNSLLRIALECGYYDHSHLTNEIKKYTGVAPTLI